jgi:hypothetical protein
MPEQLFTDYEAKLDEVQRKAEQITAGQGRVDESAPEHPAVEEAKEQGGRP